MQTFLPYPDFKKSAKSLDYRRLGKQRVEAKQIFLALYHKNLGQKYGWMHHPCVKMWDGHEFALLDYLDTMIQEWTGRGYKNTINVNELRMMAVGSKDLPKWMGNKDFHKSHQSNLVRKLPEHYAQQFDVDGDLPYIWPKD